MKVSALSFWYVMRTIALSQGYQAEVDDQDYNWLNAFPWSVHKSKSKGVVIFYAQTMWGDRKIMLMHRLIMEAGEGEEIDHVDGDGLHNQRHNLRRATRSQQLMHAQKRVGGASRFKGVSRNGAKWSAKIVKDQKRFYIGTFVTEIEAAKAYNAKALELFGPEWAVLNDV